MRNKLNTAQLAPLRHLTSCLVGFVGGLVISFAAVSEPAVNATPAVSLSNDVWPPYVEQDGQHGVAVDLIKAAFAEQHQPLNVSIKPWARVFRDVKNCRDDLLLIWYEPEREAVIRYSEPFLTNRLRFIKRHGDEFVYRNQASLDGKLIGVIRDYHYDDQFVNDDRYILHASESLLSNLRMLAANRLDLVVADELVTATTIHQQHLGGKFSFTGPPLRDRKLYLATGVCNPDGAALIERFNVGLAAIKASGKYDQIIDKYNPSLQSSHAPAIIRTLLEHDALQPYLPRES